MNQDISHFQARTALYMTRLLKADIMMAEEVSFYRCLHLAGVSLKKLLQDLTENFRASTTPPSSSQNRSPAQNEVLTELGQACHWPISRLSRDFNDILIDHPELREPLRECALKHCGRIAQIQGYDSEHYRLAGERLGRIFSLSDDAKTVLEFMYITETEVDANCYIVDDLNIFKPRSRKKLAVVLDMNISAVMDAVHELRRCCLLSDIEKCANFSNSIGHTNDAVCQVFDSPDKDPAQMFCVPLSGETLPLDNFNISPEDLDYITRLMKSENNSPIHIMIYGPPGTGKTTFARSIARELGLTAWTANTLDNDMYTGRPAAVTACMNIAAKHPGSFVVVDEAEKILHTGIDDNEHKGKEKSWLHTLLEKPNNRVIWITNHVSHIHPSVMRRFSYSIYFRPAGRKEREKLFTGITQRHNVSEYFNTPAVKALARNYDVPAAVIESAVTQAKTLGCSTGDFVQMSEQFMKSYIRLTNGGMKILRRPTNEVRGFTLEGVTLDGAVIDEIMTRCRRADEAMRLANGQLEGGCATMLFYGPPGTGKTALARHIAYELDRECIVQRASDLLNCYVGSTEKNIAEIFRKAEDEGAVLVIDEADTFLFSRDMAVHSWEVSQVNEFLTCLEECRCFCVCTTNRLKELDAASVRRFSYKAAFDYSGVRQVLALYDSLLRPLCDGELSEGLERELRGLKKLTPGDFHTVRVQYNSYLSDRSEVSHEVLVNALRRELALKHEKGSAGFIA